MKILSIVTLVTLSFICSAQQRSLSQQQFIPCDGFTDFDCEEEKKLLNSLSPIEEIASPLTYYVTLRNHEALKFEKELLECSGFFAPQIRKDKSDIYISRHITACHSDDPDEVSLQDVYNILKIIADNKEQPHQGLRKLLFNEKISLERACALLHVAAYLEIEPLLAVMKEYFAKQDITSKELAEELNKLPQDLQEELSIACLGENKELMELILHNPDLQPEHMWSRKYDDYGKNKCMLIRCGDFIVGSSVDNSVTVYNTLEKKIAFSVQLSGEVTQLACSKNGNQFSAVVVNGEIFIVDVLHNRIVPSPANLQPLPSTNVIALAHYWAGNDRYHVFVTSRVVTLYQASVQSEIHFESEIIQSEISPDTKFLVCLTKDGKVHLVDIADEAKEILDLDAAVNRIAWAPDSLHIACLPSNNVPIIINRMNEFFKKELTGHARFKVCDSLYKVTDMSWSPDGTQFAIADENGMVYIWKFASGELVHSYQTPAKIIGGFKKVQSTCDKLSWSPDGKYLAIINSLDVSIIPGLIFGFKEIAIDIINLSTGLLLYRLPCAVKEDGAWGERRSHYGIDALEWLPEEQSFMYIVRMRDSYQSMDGPRSDTTYNWVYKQKLLPIEELAVNLQELGDLKRYVATSSMLKNKEFRGNVTNKNWQKALVHYQTQQKTRNRCKEFMPNFLLSRLIMFPAAALLTYYLCMPR